VSGFRNARKSEKLNIALLRRWGEFRGADKCFEEVECCTIVTEFKFQSYLPIASYSQNNSLHKSSSVSNLIRRVQHVFKFGACDLFHLCMVLLLHQRVTQSEYLACVVTLCQK